MNASLYLGKIILKFYCIEALIKFLSLLLPFLTLLRANASVFSYTFGAEMRQRGTYLKSREYGSFISLGKKEELIHSHRYEINSRLIYKKLEFDFEISSAFAEGGFDDKSPIERNTLFLGESHLRYRVNSKSELNLGRFTQSLGSGRLIAKRLGPNVKRRFDGFLYLNESKSVKYKLFFLNEVSVEIEELDDDFSNNKRAFGIHLEKSLFELYYIGSVFENGEFNGNSGKDLRHSVGMRFNQKGKVSIDSEAIFQFGKFENNSIQNDILSFSLANTFQYKIWGLKLNYASGDKDPLDNKENTFNPLFPRGNYFDEVALVGPQNFYNFSPFLKTTLFSKYSIEVNYDAFFRTAVEDHVYAPSGGILRSSSNNQARHVHNGISVVVGRAINENIRIEAVYSHIAPGRFIKETGSSEKINFLELTLNWKLF